MDEDLDLMTREELIEEVIKLRQGIRRHRDSSRQELCSSMAVAPFGRTRMLIIGPCASG